mmetsp:Transcript_30996/g.92888  ORF Transcript_30996/g.92888 Transcript_30996/m.92888 type:complete len:335 (+) Transcript_30996:915-1919(+)
MAGRTIVGIGRSERSASRRGFVVPLLHSGRVRVSPVPPHEGRVERTDAEGEGQDVRRVRIEEQLPRPDAPGAAVGLLPGQLPPLRRPGVVLPPVLQERQVPPKEGSGRYHSRSLCRPDCVCSRCQRRCDRSRSGRFVALRQSCPSPHRCRRRRPRVRPEHEHAVHVVHVGHGVVLRRRIQPGRWRQQWRKPPPEARGGHRGRKRRPVGQEEEQVRRWLRQRRNGRNAGISLHLRRTHDGIRPPQQEEEEESYDTLSQVRLHKLGARHVVHSGGSDPDSGQVPLPPRALQRGLLPTHGDGLGHRRRASAQGRPRLLPQEGTVPPFLCGAVLRDEQ